MRHLMLAALLVGCAGGDTDDTDAGDTLQLSRTIQTDGGTYTVTWAPSTDPIVQGEDFALDVTVAPFDGVTLSWDATMPAHGHGMNTQATVTDDGGGAFTVQGMNFHMPGDWRMFGDVSTEGAVETATFDVQCCD